MQKVTVNNNKDTPYLEPNSRLYTLIRELKLMNTIRLIKKYKKDTSNLSFLELGSGSGFLLSLLRKKFKNSFILGIEYDQRLVDHSRKKNADLNVIQGNVEDFHLNDNFDIIISLQVIEHLYRPDLMLENVKKYLRPAGIFIVTTPNLNCYSHRILGKNWHGFREDHVSLKSRKEWDNFIIEKGFTRIYSGSTFFTGLKIFQRFPLNLINIFLLITIGSLQWNNGESYVGVFTINTNAE